MPTDKRRVLLGNTVWSMANEVMTVLGSVVSVLLLIPRLGATGYGTYIGMYALIGPFTAFAQSGLTLTALQGTVRDNEDPQVVVRSCISLAVVSTLILSPFIMILGAWSLPMIDAWLLVAFIVAELLVQSVLNIVAAGAQGARSFRAGVIMRLAFQTLRLVTTLVIVAAFDVTVVNLIVINGAVLFMALVVLVCTPQWINVGSILPGRMHKRHLRSAADFGVGIAASITQNDSDKVFLNASGFTKDAGLYGAAYRLVLLVGVPTSAFVSATHFAVLGEAHQQPNQFHQARRFALASLVYLVPASIACVLLARFAPLILGDDFKGSVFMVQVLTPVLLMRSVGTFFANGLMGLNRNGLRTKVLVSNAVLAVGLYAVLIPGHSWKGAAVSSLISEFSLATLLIISLWKAQKSANDRVLTTSMAS